MGTLYRIVEIATGETVGDFIIESNDATLLSSTHELITTEVMAQTLPDLKKFYIHEINHKTSQVRGRFFSLYPGQETTYLDKLQEAKDYVAAQSPVDADYEYLYNEAIATETTVALLAADIISQKNYSKSVNKAIEAQRKRGIKKVTNANDVATAKAERDGAFAALDAHVPGV